MIILGMTSIRPTDEQLKRQIEEAKKRGDTLRAAVLERMLNARNDHK